MKRHRLRVFVLFAALVLLQARIAFAVCLASEGSALDVAASCCQLPLENIGHIEADNGANGQLCGGHCIHSAAPQELESAALASFAERSVGTIDRAIIGYAPLVRDPPLRPFLTGPHATGPHLIVFFQRFLI